MRGCGRICLWWSMLCFLALSYYIWLIATHQTWTSCFTMSNDWIEFLPSQKLCWTMLNSLLQMMVHNNMVSLSWNVCQAKRWKWNMRMMTMMMRLKWIILHPMGQIQLIQQHWVTNFCSAGIGGRWNCPMTCLCPVGWFCQSKRFMKRQGPLVREVSTVRQSNASSWNGLNMRAMETLGKMLNKFWDEYELFVSHQGNFQG